VGVRGACRRGVRGKKRSASLGLTNYPQVDDLGFRYKCVNFGADTPTLTPNPQPLAPTPLTLVSLPLSLVLSFSLSLALPLSLHVYVGPWGLEGNAGGEVEREELCFTRADLLSSRALWVSGIF